MSKLKLLFIICALPVIELYGQEAHQLTVLVEGLKNRLGSVEVCIAHSGQSYMRNPESCLVDSVHSSKMNFLFNDLETGVYAITVVHDENNNGKLDLGFLKIPKEPYGFSNNPATTFGPPSFEEASFQVKSDKIVSIKL